jgi:hypothetical protein
MRMAWAERLIDRYLANETPTNSGKSRDSSRQDAFNSAGSITKSGPAVSARPARRYLYPTSVLRCVKESF